jgi:hypothetical protein
MAVRIMRGCAVLLVAGAIGFALAPLRTGGLRLGGTPTAFDGATPSSACAIAPIDAWHAKPSGGWFGYAPLTSTPLITLADCRRAARHRLSQSFVVLLIGAFVALLAYATAPVRRETARP